MNELTVLTAAKSVLAAMTILAVLLLIPAMTFVLDISVGWSWAAFAVLIAGAFYIALGRNE